MHISMVPCYEGYCFLTQLIVITVLKELLGKDWKKVARELKFSRTDIHVVAIEHRAKDDPQGTHLLVF